MLSEFKSATQIYVNPIYFELQLIWEMIFFCIPGPDDQNRWNKKNCPKFFHREIFAFWIQICNPYLCKSHTFLNTANIEKWPFFAWWPKLMKSKNCPKFFHRVISALWIQICNPNLCKSHIFWIRANIEKCSFFCISGPDDQNRWNRKKIARNSFIG